MVVRRATVKDIEGILKLLVQVDMVHHNGRPDLFKGPATKYNAEELEVIINDDTTPVFVCVDEEKDRETGTEKEGIDRAGEENYGGKADILGHAFCIHKQINDDHVMTDIRTLYIDDICVDENARGRHVGKLLYDSVVEYAKQEGFYNITLNVWSCNPGAVKFYEAMGLTPQKIGMEMIL